MTVGKLISVCQFYRNWLYVRYGVEPFECPDYPKSLQHAAWMADTVEKVFVPAGEIGKGMRWLGFIQCSLLFHDVFDLDDLRRHSRPDEAPDATV